MRRSMIAAVTAALLVGCGAESRAAVAIRIPAGHRRAAWREGMYLVALERGRATAGSVIPA